MQDCFAVVLSLMASSLWILFPTATSGPEHLINMGKFLLQIRPLLGYLFFLLLAVNTLTSHSKAVAGASNYLVGVGSFDITGPAADVNMMGYANPTQNAAGIHMRLRARAFIVAEPSSTNQGNRVVFVNTDACMGSMAVTLRVLSRLKERYRVFLCESCGPRLCDWQL